MKTLRKIMMAVFAIALIGATASCTKDDDNNGNNGNGGNDGYSAMLVGTWEIDHVSYNGQDATQMMDGIQLTFNSNGTGLMNDHGETHDNDFNWQISGSSITITVHNGYQMNFTIVSMTSSECTFTGTNMEMDGQVFQGNIEIHIVKVNNPGPNPGPEPDPENFPAGTKWNAQISQHVVENDTTDNGVETHEYDVDMNINMLFAATGNNATWAVAMTLSMSGVPLYSETINVTMNYSFDATTNTGSFTNIEVPGAEPDEGDISELPFRYDAQNNTIVIDVPEDAEVVDGIGSSIVFNRTAKK